MKKNHVVRDNRETMRREYLNLDGQVVAFESASSLAQTGSCTPAWGAYAHSEPAQAPRNW